MNNLAGKDEKINLGEGGKATNPQPAPHISVLIDGTGEGSLYLSRNIMALLTRTNTKRLTSEFLVAVQDDDDWNLETIEFFHAYMKTVEFLIGYAPTVQFVRFPEAKLSQPGFVINQLALLSRGRWILPLRASQVIRTVEWDERLIELTEDQKINSATVSTVKMDVQGVPDQKTGVAFAVSRGWYEGLQHVVKHNVTEDYIAMVVDKIGDPGRSYFLDDIEIIDPEWGSLVREMPAEINQFLEKDIETLTERIKAGY